MHTKLSHFLQTLNELFNLQTPKMKIIVVLILSITILQFLIELALAASLQSIVFLWGLLPERPDILELWPFGSSLNAVVIVFIALGTAKGVTHWSNLFLTGVYGITLEKRIRFKIAELGLSDRFSEIGVIADFFNDKAIHSASFNTLAINLLNRSFMGACILIYLFYLTPSLTLMACGALLVLAIPIFFVNKRLVSASRTISDNISYALGTLLSGIKNSLLLHIYGTSNQELEKVGTYLGAYQKGYKSYFSLSGFKSSMPMVFGIWFIGFLTFGSSITNPLSPENLISFVYLFSRFISSVTDISSLISQMMMSYSRASKLIELLTQFKVKAPVASSFEGVSQNHEKNSERILNDAIGIKLTDLSFSHQGAKSELFTELELNIPPSSVVALVGPSGIGKSTLLSLIIGLEKQSSGSIELYNENGKAEISDGFRPSYLKKIGYVGPENFIIPGSIRENLQYGSDTQTERLMWDKLNLAHCDFVNKLPDKLDHNLSEQGEGLSAGQKQRLSIARALLREPKLLILDEATSNLDAETERAVMTMLQAMKNEATILLVTHRQAVLDFADIVITMQPSGITVTK